MKRGVKKTGATAVAENVVTGAARFFADGKARANFAAFDKIMRRRGGQPPIKGDELPPGLGPKSRGAVKA